MLWLREETAFIAVASHALAADARRMSSSAVLASVTGTYNKNTPVMLVSSIALGGFTLSQSFLVGKHVCRTLTLMIQAFADCVGMIMTIASPPSATMGWIRYPVPC